MRHSWVDLRIFMAVLIVVGCALAPRPATAELADPFGPNISDGTGLEPPDSDKCNWSSSDAPLTDDFAADPCEWTRENTDLDWSDNYYDEVFISDSDDRYQAGWQTMRFISEWWEGQFLPTLRDMTRQLHASIIDQSRQIGSMMDSHAVTHAAGALQVRELEQKKRVMPNENTCVAGSYQASMSHTSRISSALTQGFKYDTAARSGGSPALQLPSAKGPGADQKARWDRFCEMFLDPQSNAGYWDSTICPNAPTQGLIMNADIDVEGFLFRDTIDLETREQLAAAMAIMENLLQPKVKERLPDGGTNVDGAVASAEGHEWILKQEHLESVRNIAAETVGSIISRRAAVRTSDPTVAQKLRQIREDAGVDPAKISQNPSYNEIMVTMTRERFFTPDYYIRMANDIGALKQEQTLVNAYISLQMEDIYKLQEQINALLAARASMKLDAVPTPSRIDKMPK